MPANHVIGDAVSPFGTVLQLVQDMRSPFRDESRTLRLRDRLRTLAPETGYLFIVHNDGVDTFLIAVSQAGVHIQTATRSVNLPSSFPADKQDEGVAYSCVIVDGEVE